MSPNQLLPKARKPNEAPKYNFKDVLASDEEAPKVVPTAAIQPREADEAPKAVTTSKGTTASQPRKADEAPKVGNQNFHNANIKSGSKIPSQPAVNANYGTTRSFNNEPWEAAKAAHVYPTNHGTANSFNNHYNGTQDFSNANLDSGAYSGDSNSGT